MASSDIKRSTGGGRDYSAGCLMLFALPFAIAGLAVLYLAVASLWSWQQMRSWEPVPAELLSVSFETKRGDDSTTYKVIARYRYNYGVGTYTSDRVAINNFADNIGDFQRDLYRRLQAAAARGERVTAYVNPQQPDEAVLHRELRVLQTLLMATFGLVFAGVGFGLMFGARIGARKQAERTRLELSYPDEPWRWRPEWQGGRIAGSNRNTAYVATGIAIFWNLVSWPALSALPGELEDGNYAALLALIFPAVGIGLAVWAVKAWLRLRRFGVSTFELRSLPAPVGGLLTGTVKATAQIPVQGGFTATLNCVEERVRRSGGKRRRSERVLWQDSETIPRDRCQLSMGYSTIPIDMRVPADQPPTNDADEDLEIIWRLEISGECPGPDYATKFDVPVFDTGEALPATSGKQAPSQDQPATLPDAPTLQQLGLQIQQLPDGDQQWVFARARHKGAAAGITIFTLIWIAVSVGLSFTDAPMLFPIVFGLFALLMIWGSLSMWFRQDQFRIGGRGVQVSGGLFGRKAEVLPGQVRQVKAVRGMQAGNKLYYDLRLETSEKRKYVLVRSLEDFKLASQLAGYLNARLVDPRAEDRA